METILEKFFGWLMTTIGFGKTLIFMVIILSLIFLGKNFVKELATWLYRLIFKKNSKRPPLKNHIAFQRLDYLYNHALFSIHTKCPLRREIYIIAMKNRISVFKKNLMEFIQNDLNKYSSEEFQLKIISVLSESHDEFIEQCRKDGIPEFIVSKLDSKIFNARIMYYSQIKLFCCSDYIYEDNEDRMYAVLDLIYIAIVYYMNQF